MAMRRSMCEVAQSSLPPANTSGALPVRRIALLVSGLLREASTVHQQNMAMLLTGNPGASIDVFTCVGPLDGSGGTRSSIGQGVTEQTLRNVYGKALAASHIGDPHPSVLSEGARALYVQPNRTWSAGLNTEIMRWRWWRVHAMMVRHAAARRLSYDVAIWQRPDVRLESRFPARPCLSFAEQQREGDVIFITSPLTREAEAHNRDWDFAFWGRPDSIALVLTQFEQRNLTAVDLWPQCAAKHPPPIPEGFNRRNKPLPCSVDTFRVGPKALLFAAIVAGIKAKAHLTPAPSEQRGIVAVRARDNLYGQRSPCRAAQC